VTYDKDAGKFTVDVQGVDFTDGVGKFTMTATTGACINKLKDK